MRNLFIYIILVLLVFIALAWQAQGQTALFTNQGGTGTTTIPTWNDILVGNGSQNRYDVLTLTEGSNITFSTSSGMFTISSSGGGSFPFDTGTNYGTTTSATTTVIHGKSGFHGSSTSFFEGIVVTDNATTSSIHLSGTDTTVLTSPSSIGAGERLTQTFDMGGGAEILAGEGGTTLFQYDDIGALGGVQGECTDNEVGNEFCIDFGIQSSDNKGAGSFGLRVSANAVGSETGDFAFNRRLFVSGGEWRTVASAESTAGEAVEFFYENLNTVNDQIRFQTAGETFFQSAETRFARPTDPIQGISGHKATNNRGIVTIDGDLRPVDLTASKDSYAALKIDPPTFTLNGNEIAISSALDISGAPSTGSTTYAVRVRDGLTFLGGGATSTAGVEANSFWTTGDGNQLTDFDGTGLSLSGTSLTADLGTAITTGEITDATIRPRDIATTSAANDSELFGYDSATGNFEPFTCAEITGSADLCDGSDDGTGGSGAGFAWDSQNYGVSTSTTLGFLGGSITTASSTWTAVAHFDGTIDFQNNFVLDSALEDGEQRLRIQAVGANNPAELFLQAKGSANSSRITITPDSSTSNYSFLEMESNGTQQIIDSGSAGTETTLPLALQMGGENALTILTDGTATTSNATSTLFTAGNLFFSGNTISSTNANGDINLVPNGTGEIVANSDIQFGSSPAFINSPGFFELKRGGTRYFSLGSDSLNVTQELNLSNNPLTDQSGTIEMGGRSGTNNERLTLDFETTANTIIGGTNTGVTDIDFSAFNLEAGAFHEDSGRIRATSTFMHTEYSTTTLTSLGSFGTSATTTFSPIARSEAHTITLLKARCVGGTGTAHFALGDGEATSTVECANGSVATKNVNLSFAANEALFTEIGSETGNFDDIVVSAEDQYDQ